MPYPVAAVHGTKVVLPLTVFAGSLDGITSAAAYSVRRLYLAYEGNCLRLRRSSDDTESDFGFDASGNLNIAAIATFVGGGSGFVTTWYDQSGNSRNMLQATATNQPLYVASSINSKPAVRFDGNDNHLNVASAYTVTAQSVLAVFLYSGANTYQRVYTQSTIGNDHDNAAHYIPILRNDGNGAMAGWKNTTIRAAVNMSQSTAGIFSALHDGTTITNRLNGANAATHAHALNLSVTRSRIGSSFTPDSHLTGDVAEVIVVASALSTANHNTVGSGAGTYYSITWTTIV